MAEKLGFEETTHFTKFFKRETGCTPTEFRQKQKTTFLNNTRLDLKESKLSDGDTIMVAQVGSSNTTFRTTKTYKYNAGTLTEMPPEKDAPENGRQAFVVEKEEKEK